MRKWTSSIVGVWLLVFGVMVSAAPNIKVVNSVYDNLTSVVRVPIEISNDANVVNLQFDLVYPNSAANAVAAFAGNALTNSHDVQSDLVASSGGTDTYRVVITPFSTDSSIASGEVLVVPFMVDVGNFSSNITVAIQNVVMVDSSGAQVTSTATSGLLVNSLDTTTDNDGDGIADAMEIASGTDPSQSNGIMLDSGSILPASIVADTILAPGSIYYANTDVVVSGGATLTIYDGAVLKFAYNAGLTIGDNGTLLLAGNVRFTSDMASPYMGSWDGIRVSPTANYTVISNAVVEWAYWGVFFDNADGEVVNCTVMQGVYGVYVYQSSDVVISQNIITANDTGVYAYGKNQSGMDPLLSVNNNQLFDNNYRNMVAFYFYNASNTHVDATNNWWGTTDITLVTDKLEDYFDRSYSPKIDFLTMLDAPNGNPTDANAIMGGDWAGAPALLPGETYHVLDTLTVPAGASMDIPAGTTFVFYGMNTKLLVDGSLTTEPYNVVNQPVVFRSNVDNTGHSNWKGIEISANANSVFIDHAEIGGSNAGIRFQQAAQVTSEIRNTYLHNNYYGVYIYKGGSPLVTGSTFENNSSGIYILGNRSAATDPMPVMTNNSFTGTTYSIITALSFQYLTSAVLDATMNYWGTTVESEIANKIYDRVDGSYYSPTVNFSPYVDGAGAVYP